VSLRDPLESALDRAVTVLCEAGPPKLADAVRHAVFPGGGRLRPRLVLAVGSACGADRDAPTQLAAAVAVELFHCASLVHDDLPCFDDASTRRGQPTVHRVHGEATAVLAGDALIVGGFEILSRAFTAHPARLVPLVGVFARALGASHGLIAGQAWESEPAVDLGAYHRAKTGALFEAAAMAGALAAGVDGEPFRALGALFGEAYQLLDDLGDALGNAETLGKPTGQDEALGRPNAVRARGVAEVRSRSQALMSEAVATVPACARREVLLGWLESTVREVTDRATATPS
jgi:geranylgeranyl diphosphate synthase, type II